MSESAHAPEGSPVRIDPVAAPPGPTSHHHAGKDHCCHDHGPLPDAADDRARRRLAVTLVLIAVFMVAEFVGGWWTGSLALIADAGHMLSDAAALAMSLFAAWIVRRSPTEQRTFGYHRAEVLVALANGATLFAVAGGISLEAWERFATPASLNTTGMLVIAVLGLVVNLLALGTLHGSHTHDMNTRGAWLHVIGDTLGSVAVIAAAILIGWTGQNWIDPAVSVAVSLLVLVSAWRLVRDALHVLMEYAPSEVEVTALRRAILSQPGVVDLHCLHVWTLGSGKHALSAHVVVQLGTDSMASLAALQSRIERDFPIGHVTIQIEPEGSACRGHAPCI